MSGTSSQVRAQTGTSALSGTVEGITVASTLLSLDLIGRHCAANSRILDYWVGHGIERPAVVSLLEVVA
jgi:hypothetical protein